MRVDLTLEELVTEDLRKKLRAALDRALRGWSSTISRLAEARADMASFAVLQLSGEERAWLTKILRAGVTGTNRWLPIALDTGSGNSIADESTRGYETARALLAKLEVLAKPCDVDEENRDRQAILELAGVLHDTAAKAIDPRDVPLPRIRPCNRCGYEHYFELSAHDLELCPKCGGALYPIVTVVASPTAEAALLRAQAEKLHSTLTPQQCETFGNAMRAAKATASPTPRELATYIFEWLEVRNGGELDAALGAMRVGDRRNAIDELARILECGGRPPNWLPSSSRKESQ